MKPRSKLFLKSRITAPAPRIVLKSTSVHPRGKGMNLVGLSKVLSNDNYCVALLQVHIFVSEVKV